MARHNRKPHRARKIERLYSDVPFEKERDDEPSIDEEVLSTGNLTPRMDDEELRAVEDALFDRFISAEEKTAEISQLMTKWECQYKGEWYSEETQKKEEEEGQIFLRKTKEQVRVVYSHILSIVSDLRPLVSFNPIVSSIEAAEEEMQRAKLAEALVDYTLNDQLKFKEDVLPQFVKSFLKYTMGILKLTYRSEASGANFILENIDRSTLYIDPHAKSDIKNAAWVMERYGLPKREVLKRIRQGFYKLPPTKTIDDVLGQPIYNNNSSGQASVSDRVLNTIKSSNTTLLEDENVEMIDYWQSPKNGLSDVYGVMVGGINGFLLRYGPNPYPYKNHPYFAKSYDPHELEVDGEGLVQEIEPTQKVINTMLNIRLADIRKHVHDPMWVNEALFNATTQKDLTDRQKFARFDKEYIREQKANNPNYNIASDIAKLGVSTSTETLWQDLQFYLGQSKEVTGVNDAMAGNAMDRQVTATQYTQTLSRATGTMRPVLLQIAALIEEVSEALLTYFKDPQFFGDEKIIQITGENKYKRIKTGWRNLGDGLKIRSVSPDDMLVDGSMKATSGFEDQINKRINTQEAKEMIQSLGMSPEIYKEASEQVNFAKIAKFIANNSFTGVEGDFSYTEEERKQKEQIEQKQIEQQRQMQKEQMELQLQLEERKIELLHLNQQSTHQANVMTDTMSKIQVDTQKQLTKLETDLSLMKAKISEDLQADKERMAVEFEFEKQNRDIDKAVNINK